MAPVRMRDRGQAAVEFAIALPLVIVVLLGVVQVLVVGRDQVAIELAAREGARAASVAATPGAAATGAANSATTLRPIDVVTRSAAGHVDVTVTYTNNTDIFLIGALIGQVELSAHVTMALEPP